MSDTSQGEGWWQASDGKWYPPEQASPAATAGAAAAGGAQPVGAGGPAEPATVGAAFNYGWLKFQQNLGVIIIAALIGFGILAVLFLIWFVAFAGLASASTDCSTSAVTGVTTCDSNGGGFVATLLVGATFGILYFLGFALFQMAIIRGSLLIVDNEDLTLAKLFSTDQLGAYIIASLLVAVFTGIGFLLCYIPGLIVQFFTLWFGYFVLGKKMAPMDAIKASFQFVNQNLGTLIVFYLASMLAYFVGAILCGIGLLVAVPVVIIAQAYMWRRLQNMPVAA
jgi:uncharacterized membrane protein